MPCLRPAEGAFPCRMPLVPRSPCADAAGMACTRRRVIRATPLRPGRTLRRMGDQALGHQRRRCPYWPADSWAGIRAAAGARWHGHDQQRAACVGALAEHRRGRGSSGDADTYEQSSEYADVAAVAAALASGQSGPVDVAVHSIGTTLRAGCSCRRRPVPAHHALRAAWVSGWPRAAQRRAGEGEGRAAAGTPDGQERPPAPGPAELAGLPCRSRKGAEFPGPFRSDGLGNHRMHDILLAREPPFPGAAIDIVLEGYDSSPAPNSSASSRA